MLKAFFNTRVWVLGAFGGALLIFHFYSSVLIFSVPRLEVVPSVVVSGNFSDPSDFSHQVLDGVRVVNSRMVHETRRANILQLDTQGKLTEHEILDQFLRILATSNIVAIISADTSDMARRIIDTSSIFGIPVILTVASNDTLLLGKSPNVLRLLANDSKQAEAAVHWSERHFRPAILYDDSLYGEYLGQAVVKSFSRNRREYYVSRFSRTSDFHDILNHVRAAGSEAVVFIGYFPRTYELVSKMIALGFLKPVLLSDGCYFPDLIGMKKPPQIFLSFPVNPSGQKGYSAFGQDAYSLIHCAINENEFAFDVRSSLLKTVGHCAEDAEHAKALNLNYKFVNGENSLAGFGIFHIP